MSDSPPSSRRDFLATAAVAGAGLALAPAVHAAGGDTLKVGLIGCGGRGTGAATQALKADRNVKLWAVGDVFRDKWQGSLRTLRDDADIAARIDVGDRCFDGFNAYQQVIGSGVDVVLLTTPPGFRPIHLKAAVDAGKHIFCEKPMAVDGPGVRSVLESSRAAKKKNLALVAGFCYRYENAKRDILQRIHDGQIGTITALQCTYNAGFLWNRPRQPGWTDMEWQLRNWLYFTWLSGDHNVEQHCHSLDKMAWAMKNEYPIKAVGMGGRQVRTGPEFGHIFDHHSVVYEYASGVKLFASCRQQGGTALEVSDFVYGTEGTAALMQHTITGKRPYRIPRGRRGADDMYQNEHNQLFASIRANRPINDGEWMARSTLMAVMGRMATYTGQVITWDMAMNSKETLMPAPLAFGPLPVPPVAKPGVTRFA